MAQDVIGYTALQVIPSLQNIGGNIEGQLAAPLVSAGRAAGQATGQAISGGIAAAQAAVERASEALKVAREKDADAVGKVRVAEEKLRELREKGTASASQLARAEEALATAQRGADRAHRTTQRAVQNLSDARAALANATDEAEESESRFQAALDNISSRLGPAAKQMAALGAATIGVGAAMQTVTEAMSREASVDVLAAQLGATPELAAEYGRIAGDLYKQGLGESFADVTQAVGTVQAAFDTLGYEGEASIDKVTERALNFQQVFGTEVPESIQTVSQLVTNGLAKDSTEAFDLLTTSFQRIPALMRDELPEIINEYGTHFRGLGFNGQEAFALLVDAAEKGKWALDKTGDALKEFTLLGSDMSQSSQDAYKAIGLDAQAMSDAVAAGGDQAQSALQQVANGLLGVQGPAERANLAIALFGTPVEDLAVDQIPQFLEALAGGSQSMTGFAGAADQMGRTVGDNAATALEKLKREVQGGLVDGLTSAAQWIDQNREVALGLGIALGTLGTALLAAKAAATGYAVAQGIMAAASGAGTAAIAANSIALGAYTIATGVIRGATMAWAGVQWLLNAALTANPIGIVVVALAALAAGVVYAYQNSETFRNIVTAAFDGIKTAAIFLWDTILKPYFTWWIDNVKTAASVAMWLYDNGVRPAFEGIGAAIGYFWGNFGSPIFNNFKLAIGLVGDAVLWWWQSVVTPAFDAVGAVISWWWQNIVTPAFDGVKSALGLVGDAFTFFQTNVVDPVMSGVGSAISFAYDNVISPTFDKVKTGIGLVGDAFGAAGGVIKTMWSGIADILRPAVHFLGGILAKVPSKIGPVEIPGAGAAQDLGKAMQSFSTGGPVIGPGSGTSDSIFAMLSDGEFVVRAQYAKQYLPLLQAINNGQQIPGFAAGGYVSADQLVDFARGVEGAEYDWGGVHWGDCSGAVSALANYATGREAFASRFATGTMDSELAERGFLPGLGPAGSLNVGWFNGGPYGGHTAATLPDGTNFEMGGERGNGQFGGQAAGADDPMFTDHAHLPPEFFLGTDGGAPTTGNGGGLGTGGGLGGSGAGASGGGGGTAGGGSGTGGSSSTTRPAGTAVPVWVDNWPTTFGSSSTSSPSSSTPSSTDTGANPVASDGGTAEMFDQQAAVDAALAKFGTAMSGAGSEFLKGQKGAIPGVGGYVSDIETQVSNITLVVADVYEAINQLTREQKRQTAGKG
ncbi:phage tail tape measure protein [Nocardia brasiliensis]|uniref:phage tail tape measure protein n=1 Tax=Nocardia brasiliensis TaxID=37326 RepID=UPI003672F8C5